MNSFDRIPGPMASMNAFARLWAPVRQMQQDSLKMANRVAHYQYAAVGNYLDWTLSWSRAATAGATQLLLPDVEQDATPSERPYLRNTEFAVAAKEAPSVISKPVKAPATDLPAAGHKAA